MAIAAVNAPITPRAPIPSGVGRGVPANFGNPRPVNPLPSNVVPGNFGGPRPVNPLPSNVVPGNFGGPRPVNPMPSNVVPGNFGGNPRPINPVAQPGTYTGPRPVNPAPRAGAVGGITPGGAAAGIGQALGEAGIDRFFDWAYPKADLPPGAVGPLPGPDIPNPARDGIRVPGLADALGIPATIPGQPQPVYPGQTDPSAIPPGPQTAPGIPGEPQTGSVAGAGYRLTWTVDIWEGNPPVYSRQSTSTANLVGPVSTQDLGKRYPFPATFPLRYNWIVEYIGGDGRVVSRSKESTNNLGQWSNRNGSGSLVRVDGTPDPISPATPPTYAPNPARRRPTAPALPRPNLPPGADPLPWPLSAPTPTPSPFPFAPAAPAPRTNPDPTAPPAPARRLDPNPAPRPTPSPNPQPQPSPRPNPAPQPNFDPLKPTSPPRPLPQTRPNATPSTRPNFFPPRIVPTRVTPTPTPFNPGINPTPSNWPETPVRIRPGQRQRSNTPTNPDLSGDLAGNPLVEILPEIVRQTQNIRQPNVCRYDSKDIAGKCEKIKDVVDFNRNLLSENLEPIYRGEINLSPCPVGEDPPQDIRNSEADGIPGIDAKLNLALDGIAALWELLRCQDDQKVFPIPDSWELKKELNCPQLVVTVKKPGDKSTYRRSFAIPHPKEAVCTEDGAKRVFTSRQTFTKGSHLTQLVLKDNSKIRLYVADRTTGQSLMDWIVGQCLDTSYQDTPPGIYRHGENSGREVAGETVEFYTVTYYSKGRESNLPDWIFTIPE